MDVIERDFDIEGFLSRPLFAHLATARKNGPCETPVWSLWEAGALWMIASSSSSFPKRLAQDGRAAIGIVDFDRERGFLQHLGLRGFAAIMPMDPDRRTRLVRRYLGSEDGWNPWLNESVIQLQDVLVRFIPETAVARDQSYFRKGDSAHKVVRMDSR